MKAADMFSLKGRVALVTGASSGLGCHFARTLADNGAAVALVARRVERLAELQASIEAAGGCAITVEADVTAKKPGAIINIASVLGLAVAKGVAAYATAKAGVVLLTKALAVELAFKGVRVNATAPGCFVTEMNAEYLRSEAGAGIKRTIPAGRFGKDGDLDGALPLLASDVGSYIAGTTVLVDGGQVVVIKG